MDEEMIFRALADPTRRLILDRLFADDGLSLQQLCSGVPLSRYGVMKHIDLLSEASLVVQRKSGRFTLHFLNPIPIQEIYNRWVSKYSQPVASGLSHFAQRIEEHTMKTKTHVYQIQIKASRSTVWQALIDPEISKQYYFKTGFYSTLKPGDPYEYRDEAGQVQISGIVLEVEPNKRLATSFLSRWQTEGAVAEPTKVTFELSERDGVSTLTVIHEGLALRSPFTDEVVQGWTTIFSGLKTLLETGKTLY